LLDRGNAGVRPKGPAGAPRQTEAQARAAVNGQAQHQTRASNTFASNTCASNTFASNTFAGNTCAGHACADHSRAADHACALR